jgi:hypothetical protein
MVEKVQKAGAMSPQKLLIGFSRDRIIFWISVAIVAHIVFIGALSLGYIRDTWIDPTGAAKRKEAAAAAVEAAKKEAEAAKHAAAGKVAKPSAPTGAVANAAATTGVVAQVGAATAAVARAEGTSTGTTEQIMHDRQNTPIIKAITEKASPEEIPNQPNDLGISINDTNVR